MAQEEENRSWSDVPDLILSLIRSRLFGRDRIMFSAVCRAWKSLPGYVREEDLSQSPCLITCSGFFHPLQNLFFQSCKTMHTFPKGEIHAQNYGWLLMSLASYPFFFNPSTNQRIRLRYGSVHSNDTLTFSNPPTSKDCQLVKFQETCDMGEMEFLVTTMKRGERVFQTKHRVAISNNELGFLYYCRAVLHKEEYYCMGKRGNMIICDSNTDKHRFITSSPTDLWEHFSASDCSHHMFEGEGDLWAVFIARHGKEVCVLKLNCTDMIWERVRDLEDRMIFVSHKMSFMERSRVKETGNKIYFPRFWKNDCLMYYCMATQSYYTVEGSSIPYGKFHESKEMVRCVWIKMNANPPNLQTREKELQW